MGGGSFFYEARATVSLALPLLGPVEGGSRLTVLGSHFRESSALACRCSAWNANKLCDDVSRVLAL